MDMNEVVSKLKSEFLKQKGSYGELMVESLLPQLPDTLSSKYLSHSPAGVCYAILLKGDVCDYELVLTDGSGRDLPKPGSWVACVLDYSSEQPVIYVENHKLTEEIEDLYEQEYSSKVLH